MTSTFLYTVKAGDWLAKIASEHGTTVSAIWNHPANADHRHRRGSPDVLYPGDILAIPQTRPDPPVVPPPPMPVPPTRAPPVPPEPPSPATPAEPPWPYPEPPAADYGEPTWVCPARLCSCHGENASDDPRAFAILLCGSHGERMSHARCRVSRGGTLLFDGNANEHGWVSVGIDGELPSRVFVQWAPEGAPDEDPYPFIAQCHPLSPFLGVHPVSLRRRLENLGFLATLGLSAAVRTFQDHYQQPPRSGQLQHIEEPLLLFHDEHRLPTEPSPPPGHDAESTRALADGGPGAAPSPPMVVPPPPPAPPLASNGAIPTAVATVAPPLHADLVVTVVRDMGRFEPHQRLNIWCVRTNGRRHATVKYFGDGQGPDTLSFTTVISSVVVGSRVQLRAALSTPAGQDEQLVEYESEVVDVTASHRLGAPVLLRLRPARVEFRPHPKHRYGFDGAGSVKSKVSTGDEFEDVDPDVGNMTALSIACFEEGFVELVSGFELAVESEDESVCTPLKKHVRDELHLYAKGDHRSETNIVLRLHDARFPELSGPVAGRLRAYIRKAFVIRATGMIAEHPEKPNTKTTVPFAMWQQVAEVVNRGFAPVAARVLAVGHHPVDQRIFVPFDDYDVGGVVGATPGCDALLDHVRGLEGGFLVVAVRRVFKGARIVSSALRGATKIRVEAGATLVVGAGLVYRVVDKGPGSGEPVSVVGFAGGVAELSAPLAADYTTDPLVICELDGQWWGEGGAGVALVGSKMGSLRDFGQTTAHELGHGLGLADVADSGNLLHYAGGGFELRLRRVRKFYIHKVESGESPFQSQWREFELRGSFP